MAKTRSLESDTQRLKRKIKERVASLGEERKPDPALQALRRYLKRAQRKHRRLAVRMQKAAPKQAESAGGTAPKKAESADQAAPAG